MVFLTGLMQAKMIKKRDITAYFIFGVKPGHGFIGVYCPHKTVHSICLKDILYI